jgi:Domain of unknown function (DUF4189)
MRIANYGVNCLRFCQAVSARLTIAVLMLSAGAVHAQDQNAQSCIDSLGYVACANMGKPGARSPAPNVVNDLWNAIAYSPSRNIAAFAGSFTAPENAKAEALKGCAEWARDCRIVVAAHDVCVAVGYERAPGGLYRWATATTKQDAQGKALSAECKAAGPQRCRVLAGCTGTPPHLLVSK